jgi:hypothetical protein
VRAHGLAYWTNWVALGSDPGVQNVTVKRMVTHSVMAAAVAKRFG